MEHAESPLGHEDVPFSTMPAAPFKRPVCDSKRMDIRMVAPDVFAACSAAGRPTRRQTLCGCVGRSKQQAARMAMAARLTNACIYVHHGACAHARAQNTHARASFSLSIYIAHHRHIAGRTVDVERQRLREDLALIPAAAHSPSRRAQYQSMRWAQLGTGRRCLTNSEMAILVEASSSSLKVFRFQTST